MAGLWVPCRRHALLRLAREAVHRGGRAAVRRRQPRGGKGLAVTFGLWSGLALGQAPLVLGLFMVLFYFTLSVDAWAVVLSLVGLLAHLLIQRANSTLLTVWAGNLMVVIWTHRRDLRRAPRLKPFYRGESGG